jgi:hypothetical protein
MQHTAVPQCIRPIIVDLAACLNCEVHLAHQNKNRLQSSMIKVRKCGPYPVQEASKSPGKSPSNPQTHHRQWLFTAPSKASALHQFQGACCHHPADQISRQLLSSLCADLLA